MSKTEKNKKEKKPGKSSPAQPRELIELTEKDLESIQGGAGTYKQLVPGNSSWTPV